MKKPSPKSGIRAWESELKKLNAAIRKAQRQGIFIEEITIARPKRATKKQVAKLTAIREQIKQRIKAIDEELPKQHEKIPEAIESRTRKGSAGVEERHARTRYAKQKEDTRLTPEQRAEVRREAARKAAQTRKKHEAEMPPEKREALRKKRAQQLDKNIGRKKDEKDLPPLVAEEYGVQADYYPQEAEIVYSKIIRYVEDIESNITTNFDSEIRFGSRVLKELLNNAISEFGYNEVMRRISTDVDRFEVNAEVIIYDSDRSHVEVAINDMIILLLGRPLTIDEAKDYENLYQNIPSYEDLIPIDLLEEPPEY